MTGHQVFGLLAVALLFALYLAGMVGLILQRSCRGGPKQIEWLGRAQRWGGRAVWLFFVINGGL